MRVKNLRENEDGTISATAAEFGYEQERISIVPGETREAYRRRWEAEAQKTADYHEETYRMALGLLEFCVPWRYPKWRRLKKEIDARRAVGEGMRAEVKAMEDQFKAAGWWLG